MPNSTEHTADYNTILWSVHRDSLLLIITTWVKISTILDNVCVFCTWMLTDEVCLLAYKLTTLAPTLARLLSMLAAHWLTSCTPPSCCCAITSNIASYFSSSSPILVNYEKSWIQCGLRDDKQKVVLATMRGPWSRKSLPGNKPRLPLFCPIGRIDFEWQWKHRMKRENRFSEELRRPGRNRIFQRSHQTNMILLEI